ncbi:LytTR family DNA-binding domain-containing protein [Mucilaginibacter sp. UR6-1]|uniref:LytR/AlgR family response regulator transcription factor n=1 Tax=Mucilaginibacter sp. UR6-1 TaxID=1435643 RepID=UPI001E64B73C|nr:LytTR family DNA-binding domain-containing protein [Mucilaginibacter sp. UR6-1]MCC8410566.1 LytTR family DNA-binding domain-containing protein [Mucilaginibacter sp. UR6-1]
MIAIAIDDEPIALDIVRAHAQKVSFIQMDGYFTNAFEALSHLQHNKVDLIFLDIKMPDISGIDFMNSLVNAPMVVFTTAYSEHAVKSFELNAVDYLLKPFSLARFLKACNKALELYELRNKQHPLDVPESIFIKDGYEQIKVAINDILFLEASGNYIKIHLGDGSLLSTRNTINEMMLMLPAKSFIRTHRAYVVARNKISKFDRYQVYINKHIVPIGATYSQCLNEF